MKDAPLDLDYLRGTLEGRRFGNPLVHFETLGSTNDRALELLDRGYPEGTLVLAEEQTRGRGRRGRTWVSSPRLGITASLLLRPALDGPLLPLVTFAASVGIAMALEEETGALVEIKWPNDLLVEGLKVGGLLAEARTFEERPAVVVGVGINVNQDRDDFPRELRDQVTSLRIARGKLLDRSALIPPLLGRWEEAHRLLAHGGESEILSRWKGRSFLREGTAVRADLGDEILLGRFRGVSALGEMLLELEGGEPRRIAFGDVRRVRGEG